MAELKREFESFWNHTGKSMDIDWYQKRLTLAAKAFEAGWKAALGVAIAASREGATLAPTETAVHPATRPQRLEQRGPGVPPRTRR
jgi:hypothetical protein